MDKGTPTVSQNPESPTSMAFREIARKMAATLSMRKKDYSSVFPKDCYSERLVWFLRSINKLTQILSVIYNITSQWQSTQTSD